MVVKQQLKFKFSSRLTYNTGFKDGFKDRPIKQNAPEEYNRGYKMGRIRRNKDL